jgi:hypothetical protein
MNPDRLYITFDVDWADDDVLLFVLELLERFDCRATFFVTHNSPVIARMKDDRRIERAIHPNFNPLLEGAADPEPRAAAGILDELTDIVPEAVACRSHSLITGTPLMRLCHERGLLIDSNVYIPYRRFPRVRPWRFWTGSLIVPFIWSDYIDLLRGGDAEPARVLGAPDTVKVVAFHPIHIYLNASDLDHYMQFKQSGLPAREARRRFQRDCPGTGDAFRRLLEAASADGIETGLLADLLDLSPDDSGAGAGAVPPKP